MEDWKKIKTESKLIQRRTEKACLIKFPTLDLMFWHPIKLVKFEGKKNEKLIIYYKDDSKFKIFKKTKYQGFEKTVDATEFKNSFGFSTHLYI